MTDHVHNWTPMPLATARYECECGATGRRKGGAIIWIDKRKDGAK